MADAVAATSSAPATTSSSGGGSIFDNPLFYIGLVVVVVLPLGYLLYKKYGQPTIIEKETTEKSPIKQEAASVTQKAASAPATSAGVDYTNLPDSKRWQSAPQQLNGFSVGQPVKVKSGAVITRMDKATNPVGNTKLTSDEPLGTIWHLFPSSMVVKAAGTYSYPFYQVANGDVVADLSKGSSGGASSGGAVSFMDGNTDFTNYDKSPFANQLNSVSGINIGDPIAVKTGVTISLFDTNMNAIGTFVTHAPPNVDYGLAWGLLPAYVIVKVFDEAQRNYVASFNGATFLGIQYKDVSRSGV